VYGIFDKLVTSGASVRVTGFAFFHCDSECAVLRYPFDYELFPRWCARRNCSSESVPVYRILVFVIEFHLVKPVLWISGVVVQYVRMFDARHECVGTREVRAINFVPVSYDGRDNIKLFRTGCDFFYVLGHALMKS